MIFNPRHAGPRAGIHYRSQETAGLCKHSKPAGGHPGSGMDPGLRRDDGGRSRQSGYLLLPVAVAIALIGVIAFLISSQSAIEVELTAGELETARAEYVAQAGLQHALRHHAQQGCGPYTNLTDYPFGSDEYDTKLTHDLGSTTQYMVTVDQDAWIESDAPASVSATGISLQIKLAGTDIRRAVYRYDLSSLAPKAMILSATAKFYADQSHPEGPIEVHALTRDWDETNANWDLLGDAMDATVLASIPPQPSADVWVAVDLTSQVQAWVNGADNFGITLNAAADGTQTVYVAREGVEIPYLEVIVGSPPTSPARLQSSSKIDGGGAATVKRDVTLIQRPGFTRLQPDALIGEDAEIWDQSPNNNYGAAAETWVSSAASDTTRSLLRFNLGTIPAGARILQANLSLERQSGSGADQPVSAHRIKNPWSEDSVTWNERESGTNWDTAGSDFDNTAVATTPVGPANQRYAWNITPLAQGWIDGSYPNYGVALVAAISGMPGERFYTSDAADPTSWPSLSVTYACECGEVCVAPQGSGNLLMVVINPTTLVAEDQKAKGLFESWGYTVSVISESANQSSYDAAVAANDVVFISETVNSGTVGTKLVNAPIGVVSQDGDYNPDLGLAPGASLKVGSTIDIVSTDHYITHPFAIGTHEIYTADMEQAIVTGSLTADQQTLAESGGDGSLVVLDQGDAMEGGGNAAGRRVILPLGTRYRFDWDYLNANGRLLTQRALEWGIGADKVNAGNLLLVVADPASLSAQEDSKKALIESWGYAVTLINDGDSQANFDTAAAANDVVYVSGSISGGALANKLTGSLTPIVNEFNGKLDNFGFSSSTGNTVSADTFTSTNAVHYISDPFAGGAATVFSSSLTMPVPGGTLAPDLETVGETAGAVPALVTLDTGAERWDGNPAPARRVHLPFGAATASQLTDDGKTLTQRAIEWAGGAVLPPNLPIAHWKLDETIGLTAVDSVGSYDGTLNNGPSWTGGMLDGGLAFDGNDDYIDVSSMNPLDYDDFTIVAWYRSAETTLSDDEYIFIHDDSFTDEVAFGPTDDGGETLRLGINNGGSWDPHYATSDIVDQQWHHLAAVRGGGRIKLYVDGVEESDAVDAHAGMTVTVDGLGPFIGDLPGVTEQVHGTLDDVRFYDSALSAGDIAELAKRPGPIAHWKLDDGSGPTAIDSVGGNDATLNGDQGWTTGVLAGALDFDGSGDYATTDNNFTPPPVGTVLFWMKVPGSPGSHGRILGLHDTWEIRHVTTGTPDGIPYGLVFDLGVTGVNTEFVTTVTVDTPDQWYFVAATYDTNNDAYAVYLDGALHKSGTYPSSLAVPAAAPLSLGTRTGSSNYFTGVLDDVQVFDRWLSASEIADLYAAGAPSANGYIELYQPWSAIDMDIWETVSLDIYGVPANAVVEVAVVNNDTGAQRWGGVRAVGSTLDRRIQLHEAEGNGVDVITMHVQADASSQIQHYSDDTADITFVLLGYWTGASYVELFEPFTANNSNTWVEEGLADDGLGPNQVAEIAMINTNTGAERLAGVRPSGATYQRRFNLQEAESGGVDAVTMMVNTDASTIAEVFATSAADIDFYVLGYWSTPPGTYTENGGLHGQVSTLLTWETNDLSSFGVPADSVAQFVMTNESTGAEVHIGVRETGSTLQRVLDIQEAEGGGSDAASMHVNVDGSSQVQWYSEYGSGTRDFYPVGWWVLSP